MRVAPQRPGHGCHHPDPFQASSLAAPHTRGRLFWSVWAQIDGGVLDSRHADLPRTAAPVSEGLARAEPACAVRARGRGVRAVPTAARDGTALPAGRALVRSAKATWRDRRGRAARWPDLEDLTRQRTTRIVLAAAHVNHDPTRSGQRNLRAWCQACHLAHDRAWHLLQRWISYRLRYARGDLFLGRVPTWPASAILLAEILARISDRLSDKREPELPPRFGRDVWTGDQLAFG